MIYFADPLLIIQAKKDAHNSQDLQSINLAEQPGEFSLLEKIKAKVRDRKLKNKSSNKNKKAIKKRIIKINL